MSEEIIELFPTPLVIDENVKIDPKELKWLLDHSADLNNFRKNQGSNYASQDNYILENTPKLYADLQNSVEMYSKNIFLDEDVMITQSWLNRNSPGTMHTTHSHTNSVISGVFYLQVDEKTGDIWFHRPADQLRHIQNKPIEKDTKYTYRTWGFTPKFGQLFMFPSTLLHSVVINDSSMDRISLSFNTFYSGSFGDKITLSHVDPKRMRGKS